jgi:hypothetical protein
MVAWAYVQNGPARDPPDGTSFVNPSSAAPTRSSWASTSGWRVPRRHHPHRMGRCSTPDAGGSRAATTAGRSPRGPAWTNAMFAVNYNDGLSGRGLRVRRAQISPCRRMANRLPVWFAWEKASDTTGKLARIRTRTNCDEGHPRRLLSCCRCCSSRRRRMRLPSAGLSTPFPHRHGRQVRHPRHPHGNTVSFAVGHASTTRWARPAFAPGISRTQQVLDQPYQHHSASLQDRSRSRPCRSCSEPSDLTGRSPAATMTSRMRRLPLAGDCRSQSFVLVRSQRPLLQRQPAGGPAFCVCYRCRAMYCRRADVRGGRTGGGP